MLDFLKIATRCPKKDVLEIYPKFIIKKSSDLMIRGGDFYAIWIEEKGLWSTDEQDAIRLIDNELRKYREENKEKHSYYLSVSTMYLWDADTRMIDKWHKYCQKQMRDNFSILDEQLIFSNVETNKKDYASKKLSYPLEAGDISAYDKLMSTLYSPEERHKIEWAIGSIVTGDSRNLQKFLVLYGAHGTGKSTVLNIIQWLFEGYYSVFDAKALGSANSSFALEPFKDNPLVAIQHDGDLSKIEDNTRLNSVVSHELMTVNEKFKSTYSNRFKCFLFMGTNKPVKITDGKSGLIRRLIDVTPSGNKLAPTEYKRTLEKVKFELGAIAWHCKEIYLEDPDYYNNYIPMNMMGASNDFYNFVVEYYLIFKKEDSVTLKAAWEMYKTYCEEAKVLYPYPKRAFKEELKNYFRNYNETEVLEDGTRVRGYYAGFKAEQIDGINIISNKEEDHKTHLIQFDSTESIFDKECADYPAQYVNEKGTPINKWEKVTTKLSDLDTNKIHYVKVPENHIVIDFDIPDENGNKSFEKNLEAASKWPVTYAELSKSGAGIHLHYIYTGDVSKLSRVYDDHIEIKIFNGNSSLRRKLTKCNNLPIATINSGLPLKEVKNVISWDGVETANTLKTKIIKTIKKEYKDIPSTKCGIDFINNILEEAYNSGLKYDVSNMMSSVLAFAANSTNNSDYCLKLVNKMKFKSDEPSDNVSNDDAPIVFYDVEVFPNLFLVNWKFAGENNPVIRMINPTSSQIEELMNMRLVGFNCRRYDNHILYARLMGYSNKGLYELSQKIINEGQGFFGEAYNISYTDIYDFSAKKQSLKKWEIELGIHHQELGLPWDKPVPEELWIKVAEYCDNDVIATEAVYNHLQADFLARQILADLAGGTVNDTTNSLTTKIIFGKERHPQDKFNYRDMGAVSSEDYIVDGFDDYTRFNKDGKPVFPGYEYSYGKSTYRDEEVGEGGYVYSEPGMYGNVALLDIASMHPHSIIAEWLFGEYTAKFKELVDGRVDIKHEDWEAINDMLDGKLTKYVQKVINGELTSKNLANALKIAINSVYGLTSARFENPFRDPRNVDNIVAKRGALFMINLKHEVQKRGFTVAHIKTDSIKIPDATPEIIQFVMDYGKMYGYTFEHEATYERMCLVNDAVYIAKDKADGHWTATGTQFQVPYVFKKLFSKEDIVFEDMCETKSVVQGTIYLDRNESLDQLTPVEEKELDKIDKAWHSENQNDLDAVAKKLGYSDEQLGARYSELCNKNDASHNYIFVGRVGQFTPIKPGCGGGVLYREKDGKYYAVTGTKGYRWLESEMVKELGKENDIDRTYYDNLVTEAANDISKYGDFEWFVSDDPYVSPSYDEHGRPIYLDLGYTVQTAPAF